MAQKLNSSLYGNGYQKMEFNLFKIKYTWYEGEYEETSLGKNVKIEEFEKDLIGARDFAKSLIGKKLKNK